MVKVAKKNAKKCNDQPEHIANIAKQYDDSWWVFGLPDGCPKSGITAMQVKFFEGGA